MPTQRMSASASGGAAALPSAWSDVVKRLLQEIEAAGELGVGDRQRRQQPQHVAVRAAREQDEAALERRRCDGGGELATLLAELERAHGPEAAVLAHGIVRARDR